MTSPGGDGDLTTHHSRGSLGSPHLSPPAQRPRAGAPSSKALKWVNASL